MKEEIAIIIQENPKEILEFLGNNGYFVGGYIGRVDMGYYLVNTLTKLVDFNWNSPGKLEIVTLSEFKERFSQEIVGYTITKLEFLKPAMAICQYIGSNMFEGVLKESKPGDTITSKLKEAGVLDLWFKPIYKSKKLEIKAGDWVVPITESSITSPHERKTNRAYKVWGEYSNTENIVLLSENNLTTGDTGVINIQEVRLASPAEIELAKTIVVKMNSSNKGIFNIHVTEGVAIYRRDNQILSKEFVEKIISSFNCSTPQDTYKIFTNKMSVGCMNDTKKEDWETLHVLLK